MPEGQASADDEAGGNRGRPLDHAGRRALIEAALKARPGDSNRAIAADLGVDDKTVAVVRSALEATAEIPRLTKTIGADGKERRKPSPRPRTAPATTAADLAALAAAIKRDREIDNARFFALERSDAENRKLLGREPPAPTPGSEWVFVKEAAGLAGRSESAVWNWIKRGQIKPLTSPTGRTIVRISDLPPKRTAARKCIWIRPCPLMSDMTDVDNEIIETLETAVARAAAEHTRLSWDLQLMKAKRAEKAAATAAAIEKAAMKRQGKLVDLPSDPIARGIIQAGRRRRGEIQ